MSVATDRLNGITGDVAVKAPVNAVTSANITLAGLQTIGGVVLVEGNRVLVKDQTDTTENGIYNASTSAWTRTKDFDGNRDAVKGTLVVTDGVTTALLFYRLTTADPVIIGTSAITFEQASEIQNPNPRTQAEINVSVVPVLFSIGSNDTSADLDPRRHGFGESKTEAQNAAALASTIAVLQNLSSAGGEIKLPPGFFDVDQFSIPELVVVTGCGRGTRLRNGDSGYFIKIGGEKTGALKYNCGIRNVGILTTHKDAFAIRLMETCGATVSDIYAEGSGLASRTDRFLTIDGGDVSSFFNFVSNCIANHYQVGYRLLTTGSSFSTRTTILNCTSFGDVSSFPTSLGLQVDQTQGTDAHWIGGNLESCGKAVLVKSGAGSVVVEGLRFEGNTTDIEFEATPNPWVFAYCKNVDPAKIVDNSGGGYELHRFYGCGHANGLDVFGDRFIGNSTFRSGRITDIPVDVQAYPSQTSVLLRLKNSAGTSLFEIYPNGSWKDTNNGVLHTAGAGSPEGVITANPGSTYSDTTNGVQYSKKTGIGNTGWKLITQAA